MGLLAICSEFYLGLNEAYSCMQEEGATDAFQRLVKAYQNLLKYAKKA